MFLASDKLNDPNTPLLLWLNGGPGSSSQIGNFLELGPVFVTKKDGKYTIEKRDVNWSNDYHVIFVDSPAGTGYSVALDNYKVTTT